MTGPGSYGRNDAGDCAADCAVIAKAVGKPDPVTVDTLYRIASMTKMVTTVAALQLAETGVIDFDDAVAKYRPEFADLKVLDGWDGDEPRLREHWFQFRDRTGEEKAAAAVAFAELSVSEADRVGAPNLVRTQAAWLDRVRAEHVAAKARLERVRRSPLSRLSGDFGL